MKIFELKKGDIIHNVQFGFGIHKAKVIENFPSKRKIYVKIYVGFCYRPKKLINYSDYNLELIND
jgi:hypothetical protein